MLKNAPTLVIRGVDTEENEPSKVSMKWGVPNRSCTRHMKEELSRGAPREDSLMNVAD